MESPRKCHLGSSLGEPPGPLHLPASYWQICIGWCPSSTLGFWVVLYLSQDSLILKYCYVLTWHGSWLNTILWRCRSIQISVEGKALSIKIVRGWSSQEVYVAACERKKEKKTKISQVRPRAGQSKKYENWSMKKKFILDFQMKLKFIQ